MSRPVLQQYTREQMEELAKNKDNIVMVETESKSTTANHKFRNSFLLEQVLAMRALFVEYIKDYPKYTENEIRTKVLSSSEARANSWMVMAANRKFILERVLKKWTEPEDEKKYDALLKLIELEDLRDKGYITSNTDVQAYLKRVGLSKECNPVQHALDEVTKGKN